MNDGASAMDLGSKKAELERAVGAAGAAMSDAIAKMGTAIREHGENSRQARLWEAKADAAFDLGEEIVVKLLAIEAEMEAASLPLAA